jgi:hypothetical protein
MEHLKLFKEWNDFTLRLESINPIIGNAIKGMATVGRDEIELTGEQKRRIKRSGLKTGYKVFGTELQFTIIGQNGGSEVAHIIKTRDTYFLSIFFGEKNVPFNNLDDAIDTLITFMNRH